MEWPSDTADATYRLNELLSHEEYFRMAKHDKVLPRPVYTGTFKVTPKMRQLLDEVLDSGRISYGEKSLEFEKRFAAMHNCKYAILSNSGTSALQIALQALKEVHRWPDGGMVIVPATTFVATANIVAHCRMVPVFVDVKEDTFNMDMEQVDQIVKKNHKDVYAVIPVHLLGLPADMLTLDDIISNYPHIKMIEDSCECMFVDQKKWKVGSMGDIGCFSTYVAHLIVTGVGGISTTNEPAYASKMRSLVNHGLEIKYLNVDDNFAPRPMMNRRFSFDSRGYSYRITEFEAAVGLAQLDTYEEMLRIRNRNAKHLTAGLEHINRHYGDPFKVAYTPEGYHHAHMMYPICLRYSDGIHPDKEPLMRFLNERQIETRDLLPLLNNPIYSWVGMQNFPVSSWLIDSAFYVGCHQDMQPSDCDYIIQCLEEYFSVLSKA